MDCYSHTYTSGFPADPGKHGDNRDVYGETKLGTLIHVFYTPWIFGFEPDHMLDWKLFYITWGCW